MHLYQAVLLASFLAITSLLPAQDQLKCGTSQIHQELLASQPELVLKEQAENELIRQLTLQNAPLRRTSAVMTIPVVVRIVHFEGTPYGKRENISDGKVKEAIHNLNQAFRNVGYYDPETGADIEIEFCLASQSPDGHYTNGITRVANDSLTNLSIDQVSTYVNVTEAEDYWGTLDYCHIRVMNSSAGYRGFAYYPLSHLFAYNGVYMRASVMAGDRDDHKTLAHELGHYLNLRHTFEGGCPNSDCLQFGDLVCDTPPQTQDGRPSCQPYSSCQTDADDPSPNNPFHLLGDQVDMHENYMDYSSGYCQDRFTPGQKVRMRYALTELRSSLLDSKGCINPGQAAIHFKVPEIDITESSRLEQDGRGYRDVEVTLQIGAPPVGDAQVEVKLGGTAIGGGIDYTVLNDPTLLFPHGSTEDQTLTLRIWDTPEVETLETIDLFFDIKGQSNAMHARFHQTCHIDIIGEKIGLFNAYPNPFSESLTVDFFAPRPGYVVITLFDQVGQLVHQEEQYRWDGDRTLKVQDLGKLVPGIYYLRLSQGEYQDTRKLIKL